AIAQQEKGKHIITSEIEHHAVLKTCEYLETQGFEVTYLPVDRHGIISVASLAASMRTDTILVSIMYGNNEIGSIQPIAEIGELLKDHPALFHTDAVQAYGLLNINVEELGVDLLTASAHKINGPRGVGFLYAKNGTRLAYQMHGGEQERKRRAGTENLAGICGFSAASTIMTNERTLKTEEYISFKKRMAEVWREAGLDFEVNGLEANTLPHVFSVRFPGISIEQLLMNLDMEGIAVSSGSACTAGTVDPSHVLVALFGDGHPAIQETVRISFGLGNHLEEVETAATKVSEVVKRLMKI
ncbi:cysteine desulfurase, partial [Listeria ivanovii FSL F6-596]